MYFGKWPASGILQLVIATGMGFLMFTRDNGPRFNRTKPSFLEEFQSGNPSDFAVLFVLGWIIVIGYAIAVTIMDYRRNQGL
ncbi:hypothetical protein N8A98_13225 [Devosia neptuniae]|uniref:Uncharacterized protein n=1 Tax=Devosia neptuniae TaxID=191302 RepID=A0ABY6C7M6_9HYPH|nr:hypothetical protein [Devosia neptuniae]UXN68238.1 hypothetical protein N8A98_13225 [Devosia neptuniae]